MFTRKENMGKKIAVIMKISRELVLEVLAILQQV